MERGHVYILSLMRVFVSRRRNERTIESTDNGEKIKPLDQRKDNKMSTWEAGKQKKDKRGLAAEQSGDRDRKDLR